MNRAAERALDERLRRVHKRWSELTAEYVRTYGAINGAVFCALFDRAAAEVGR